MINPYHLEMGKALVQLPYSVYGLLAGGAWTHAGQPSPFVRGPHTEASISRSGVAELLLERSRLHGGSSVIWTAALSRSDGLDFHDGDEANLRGSHSRFLHKLVRFFPRRDDIFSGSGLDLQKGDRE